MDELVKALKTLLANQVTLYLKASGFHWNVEGPHFHEFHDLFGDIYSDVYGSIDPTAENIRKLGEYAPFQLPTLDSLRTVKDKKTSTDAIEMCVELADANDELIKNINQAYKAAQKASEQGISNFLADRDDMHKKWRWQLEATLKRLA